MSSKIIRSASRLLTQVPEWPLIEDLANTSEPLEPLAVHDDERDELEPEPEPEPVPEPEPEPAPAHDHDAYTALLEQQTHRISHLETQLADLRSAVPGRIEQARQAGLREGEATGFERARLELASVIDRLARSIAEVAGFRAHYRRESEQELLKLSLGVARKVLHRELTVDPRALLGVIRSALESLNAAELYRIRLAPAEAEPLAARIAEMGLPERVEVTPDPTLERGAVIFETARGTVDASLPTQLAEIERGFTDLLDSR